MFKKTNLNNCTFTTYREMHNKSSTEAGRAEAEMYHRVRHTLRMKQREPTCRWRWCSRWVESSSCDPTDCSPPGSSVHGILQPRILEWVTISFSRGSFPPRNRTWVSCIAVNSLTTELQGNQLKADYDTLKVHNS